MKKIVVSFLSLLTIAGIMSSCQKDQHAGNGSKFTATMESCTSSQGKTVLDGSMLNWVDGDQIKVFGSSNAEGVYSAVAGTDDATTATFENVEGDAGSPVFHAIYPASVAVTATGVTLPAEQVTVDGSLTDFPMYATSENNSLQFQNLCGILKFRLTKSDVSISSISVTTSDATNGNFTVSYDTENKPVLTSTGSATKYTTTLTCTTPQDITDGADFYMYLPQGNYYGMEIVFTTSTGMTCTKTVSAENHIDIVRSQYSTLTLSGTNLDFVPDGTLSGLFTIDENGTKIRFAKGNLQYQPSTDTWRFAEHQYDYIAQCNQSVDPTTYTGWLDMFLCGTGDDMSATSATATSADFTDWGTYPISNGGETGGLWRTLTYNEWYYIFVNSRGNSVGSSGFPFGPGKVNGIKGIILLPDSFVTPDGIDFTAFTISNSEGWNTNVYTSEEWTAMEEAGAVFLPAAGCYLSTSLTHEQVKGYYWSKSRAISRIPQFAFFSDHDGFFYPLDWKRKYPNTLHYSCSVRLVCEQQ